MDTITIFKNYLERFGSAGLDFLEDIPIVVNPQNDRSDLGTNEVLCKYLGECLTADKAATSEGFCRSAFFSEGKFRYESVAADTYEDFVSSLATLDELY